MKNSPHRHPRLSVAFCALLLAVSGCFRESAWDGTWKLNVSKSQAYGRNFAIAIAPDGLVTVTTEATSYSFRCDGKGFQSETGDPTVCTPLGSNQWRFTVRSNGKDSAVSTWQMSPDSKTLALRTTEFHSDGTQESTEQTAVRRSETKGFVGRWQDLTPLKSLPQTLDLAINGQRLHFAFPELGQYSDSPLDGSMAPIHGPNVGPNSMLSVRASAPREFHTQSTISGRVIREGTLDLSEDGRTLFRQSWAPENPEEKDRLVYDKQ